MQFYQIIEGEERVIAYGSRILTKAERAYCVTRREMLAVAKFCKYCRHYLLGRPFLLRSDQASLRWLKSVKEPEGQVARWLEVLDTFDFKLEHRPGVKHANADALSRVPCSQCKLNHTDPKSRRGRPLNDSATDCDISHARPVQTRAKTSKTLPATTPQKTNWLPDTLRVKRSGTGLRNP